MIRETPADWRKNTKEWLDETQKHLRTIEEATERDDDAETGRTWAIKLARGYVTSVTRIRDKLAKLEDPELLPLVDKCNAIIDQALDTARLSVSNLDI
jgi:hypothetical protein